MPALSAQDPPTESLLAIAVDAARQAGGVLQECARTGFRVEHKNVINLVTDADRRAEQCIIDVIGKAFPSHRILAEEHGTTNFIHGFPAYCVSIGVERKGCRLIGVVFDPTRDELFAAQRGKGALLNNEPITVSTVDHLDCALLVTGFAYDIRDTPNNNLDHFARFALKAQGVRRTGTAALDLCYVASGRFDGFWEVTLNPWDVAAGTVILEEAGGKVTNFTGGKHSIYGKELVASNGRIHQAMIEVLRQSRPLA